MTTENQTQTPTPIGVLAQSAGYLLEVQILRSAAGYYLGTEDEYGPVSRESEQYWRTHDEALQALESGNWNQRLHP